jgi:hypothetical protein
MMDNGEEPYSLVLQQGRFSVEDASGATILTCADKDSAEHYIVLLRAAYRRGFKAGFQAARQDAGTL